MATAMHPTTSTGGWKLAAVGAVLAAQVGLAVVAAADARVALLLAGAACALVLAATVPALLPVVAFPATFGYWRFGPASLNMSLADVMLIAAIVPSLAYVPWRSRAVRSVMSTIGVYTGLVAICVASAYSRRAGFEWLHRIALTGGAVVVGVAVARLRATVWALRVFGAATVVVGMKAVANASTNGHQPAYPFGIHKNAAGALLMIALVLSFTVPARFGVHPKLLWILRGCAFVGLIATQSKASMLALSVVLVMASLRKGVRNTTRLAVVAMTAIVIVAAWSVYKDNTHDEAAYKFNTVGSRVVAYDAAYEQFRAHPISGAGLRWFRAPEATSGEPHSVLFVTLSETGLLGGLALATLLTGTLLRLRRVQTPLAEAAAFVVIGRLMEGSVAIYWVAGTMTITWLLVGLALGDASLGDSDEMSDPNSTIQICLV